MYNNSQQLSNLFIRNIVWPISVRASCSLSTLPAYHQQNSILWKAITKNEYQSAQPIVLRGNVNILMVISVSSYSLSNDKSYTMNQSLELDENSFATLRPQFNMYR